MATKIKCPACGAKNVADSRRCRVCTGILNLDAPEPGKGAGSEIPAATPSYEQPFDADVINRQLRPAAQKFSGGGGGLGARLAAAGSRPAPRPAPPTEPASAPVAGPSWATTDDTFGPIPSTPDAFIGPVGPPSAADPPAEERFDPDVLFRDQPGYF